MAFQSLKAKWTSPELSADEKLHWLQLSRSQNVGPVTFFGLLQKYGSAKKALEQLPFLAQKGGGLTPLKIFSQEEARMELECHQAFGSSLIAYGEELYPKNLYPLSDAPPLLSVKGNLSLLNSNLNIAIVGARNASAHGKHLARTFAKELSNQGATIVSGLARGIDSAAHTASFDSGTIAVVAGGINTIYPTENESLFHEISQKGLLISESAFDMPPSASLFPRRNRIIAGLSQGLIIIEAALRSGSLITAHRALDYGRDIFVVPGSPLDPRYHGSNRLIRDGAILVQSTDDVISGLNKTSHHQIQESSSPSLPSPFPSISDSVLEKARKIILENLSFSPISIDELIQECQLSPTIVMTVILELELGGRVLRSLLNEVSLKTDIQS